MKEAPEPPTLDPPRSYVLVGIGILVEVARRLGMGFIASRDELAAEKAVKKTWETD